VNDILINEVISDELLFVFLIIWDQKVFTVI